MKRSDSFTFCAFGITRRKNQIEKFICPHLRSRMPRSKIYLIAFVVTFILWTIGLLIPVPHKTATQVLDTEYNVFVASKMVHVSAYAFLTVLAGLLTLTNRQRWFVLGLLSFHGFATEF